MNDFPNLFPASALSKAGGSDIAIESGNVTINAVEYPIIELNLYGKSTTKIEKVSTTDLKGATCAIKAYSSDGSASMYYANCTGTLNSALTHAGITDIIWYQWYDKNGNLATDRADTSASMSLPLSYGYELYGSWEYADGSEAPTNDKYTEMELLDYSVGETGIEITACGKNLLPYPYEYDTMEISGLTFTVNDNRTIAISGTTTAMTTFRLYGDGSNTEALAGITGGKTYKLSENVACKVMNSVGQARYVNTTVTLAEDEIITYVYVQYGADVTVNTTLYPMIQLAGTDNTYEPYKANTAFISSGMPLCSVGDVRDELIYRADGTGKIIKKLGVFTIDGTESYKMHSGTTTQINISDAKYNTIKFMTTDADVPSIISTVFTAERAKYIWYGYRDNSIGLYGTVLVHSSRFATVDDAKTYFTEHPATFVTELAEPQEIELSASEMAELQGLQTFDRVTNIFNDEGAEMSVKIATNPLLSEYVKPVIEGITARFEARIAALESAITNN